MGQEDYPKLSSFTKKNPAPKNGIKNYNQQMLEKKNKFKSDLNNILNSTYQEMLKIEQISDISIKNDDILNEYSIGELVTKIELFGQEGTSQMSSTNNENQNEHEISSKLLSIKVRAQQILLILCQMKNFIHYLSEEKIEEIIGKLKILEKVPVVRDMILEFERTFSTTPFTYEKVPAPKLQTNITLPWKNDIENSATFKSNNSFQSYKKARENFLKAIVNERPNFLIKSAFCLAAESGNLLKFGYFVVRCLFEMGEGEFSGEFLRISFWEVFCFFFNSQLMSFILFYNFVS